MNTLLAKESFPVWPFPIARPHAGPMLGNTRIGVLAWGEGNVLKLTVGRADFWSHRGGAHFHEGQTYAAIRRTLEAKDSEGLRRIFVPNKDMPQMAPLGRLEVRFAPSLRLDTIELDMKKGRYVVALRGKAGAKKDPRFTVALDWPSGALALDFPAGLAPEAVVPVAAWRDPFVRSQFEACKAPAPLEEADGFSQPLENDPACALAVVRAKNAWYAATARGGDPRSVTASLRALDAARKAAAEAAAIGAKTLFARTAARWEAFWAKSPRLRLPNPVLQRLYEYGMYKFGGATSDEPGSLPCPLQGPWVEDYQFPPWSNDYHFNINVQECYWPGLRGNHVEHLRPLFAMVKTWIPRLRENARLFVGIDDGILLPHAVDDRGVAISAGFWTGVMDHGSTMWVADLMFQYYLFGGDRAFLKSDAFPFAKGAFNVFYKMLDRAPDGTLSLPVGPSPEYRAAALDAWGKNSSFQLAAAHRLAENLVETAAILKETPDPRWSEVLEKLPKAALVENGQGGWGDDHRSIGLWEGLTLESSHRHHSHMASIFPFNTIDCTDGAWAKIVDNTFRHWMCQGTSMWSGWCCPWASTLHSRVGNADAAELVLEMWERAFTNEGHGTLHDTRMCGISLFGMGGFETVPYPKPGLREIMQLDAGESAVEAIFEMLCHDRRGTTVLFRGVPARWLDVGFDGILAPGGVLVAASRKNGKVSPIKLTASARATVFRLENPWKGSAISVVREGRVQTLAAADVLDIRLAKGESVVLKPTA